MRAETVTGRVTFQVSELDKEDGVSVKSRGLVTYDPDTDDTVDFKSIVVANEQSTSGKEVIDKVVTFKGSSEAKNYTDLKVYVYNEKGYLSESASVKDDGWAGLDGLKVADGYRVLIEYVVDRQTAGTLYGDTNTAANGDGKDDRLQPVITVVKQIWDSEDFSAATESYVVNSGENVAKMIEDGDYANFPGWNAYEYDEDNDYVYVYNNALNNVTKDIEVKATWAVEKDNMDRFAPAATNDKDTNGDGKVSCDEYYGTTGLVWSDEKNTCVVESNGAVVVTIPNTATK